MIKFIYKIPINEIEKEQNYSEYFGIKFKLRCSINDEYLGINVGAILPYGYDNVKIKMLYGILNNKNSIVNKHIIQHTYSYNVLEMVGKDNVIMIDKIKKHGINGYLNIILEILECNFYENQSKMMQKIYTLLNKEELDKRLNTLEQDNIQLEEHNKELQEKVDINSQKSQKLRDDNIRYQLELFKKDCIKKDEQLYLLNEKNKILQEEFETLKKEYNFLNGGCNLNKYINIQSSQITDDNDDNNAEIIDKNKNVVNDRKNPKYYINIMNLDKINVDIFNTFDLRVLNSKLDKLKSLITDKIDEHENCSICYSNSKNCVFVPCGHRVACNGCSINLKNKCPVCRHKIETIIKIYD